jgi:hypothetical protein
MCLNGAMGVQAPLSIPRLNFTAEIAEAAETNAEKQMNAGLWLLCGLGGFDRWELVGDVVDQPGAVF